MKSNLSILIKWTNSIIDPQLKKTFKEKTTLSNFKMRILNSDNFLF